MSEYSAKTLRDKMKAKAKSLAKPGDYVKDQEVSSANWSPAPQINADVKTGARPISPRAYKRGGAVKKASGGEIADSIVNRNVKEANAKRPGAGKHVGAFMCGGKTKRATGGNVPSDAETRTEKSRIGTEKIKPTRGKAENYMCGGRMKRDSGGGLPSPEEAIGSEERLKGIRVMPAKDNSAAAQVTPSQLRREEGYTQADMKAKRAGRAEGGKKWIQSAIKKPGALHKSLGVPAGEKIPAKKLAKAAEKGGKLGQRARLAQTLKRMNRASGGAADKNPFSTAAKDVRMARKTGGRAKDKTDINIVIATGPKGPGEGPIGGMMKPPAIPIPVPAPGAGAPPPAAMPPMSPPPGAGMPPGRKEGGRISKVASSYKDMTAGSGSGEGRLQKTDIAKKHGDAPAKKDGGRLSKVAKSYKDMTAGSASGEGRLQKTDIAKRK